MRRDTYSYILTSFYVYPSIPNIISLFIQNEVKLSSVRFIYSATNAVMRPE